MMIATRELPLPGADWPERADDQGHEHPKGSRFAPVLAAFFAMTLMLASACAPTAKGSVKDLVDAEVFVHVEQSVNAEDREKAEDLDNAEDFLREYLAEPGKEYYASHIARLRPDTFLPLLDALLENDANIQMKPRALLVRGDLLFVKSDREAALGCYRQVAGMIADDSSKGWEEGFVPSDYYFVEPDDLSDFIYPRPRAPFERGSGSHGDNLLLRRFVALDAGKDAAREYLRIWNLHEQWTGENQFSSLGLGFALDYAEFLKRYDGQAAALDLLLEPILRIDLEHNPQFHPPVKSKYWFHDGPDGAISRKEFIRLTSEEFQRANEQGRLVSALRKQISSGDNRALPVLAQVQIHLGDIDEAVKLEREYLESAGFDALTSAYRLGLFYEDCDDPAAAAAQYEKVLSLPYVPPQLPDRDEESYWGDSMVQMAPVYPRLDTPEGEAWFQSRLLGKLRRLYKALDDGEKTLQLTLRQCEANPDLLEDFNLLAETARQYQKAGQEAAFATWAREQAAMADSLIARANLWWFAGDRDRTIEALAEIARDAKPYALEEWKNRFYREDINAYPQLVTALAAANPMDARFRMDRLHFEYAKGGPEVIATLESLLESDQEYLFHGDKGIDNHTQFRNSFDLAYRLLRFYERDGAWDKFKALGLRMAAGEKPFDHWRDTWGVGGYRNYYYGDDYGQDINACFALAIQHADPETLAELDRLLAPTPESPWKTQLERRISGGWKPDSGPAVGWANLPKGVSALACGENIQSLARDEKYVYAGMLWGVSVYTHDGNPVTRVAVGDPVTDMVEQNGYLWLATEKDVFRLDPNDWSLARMGGGAQALCADGDFLWLAGNKEIRRYNVKENTFSVYDSERLYAYTNWSNIVTDGDLVWAEGYEGTLQYNKLDQTWRQVTWNDANVHINGIGENEVWGHLTFNEQFRDRPCLIDRDTLAVTPFQFGGDLSDEQLSMNGPFIPLGTWNGVLVFDAGGVLVMNADGHVYSFDRNTRTLRREVVQPQAIRRFQLLRPPHNCSHYDRRIADLDNYLDPDLPLRIGYDESDYTNAIHLPGGASVYGMQLTGYYDGQRGGLFWQSPQGEEQCVTASVLADALPGDSVYAVVPTPNGPTWACTSKGLAALDADGNVLAHFSREDGLCANNVRAGVHLDGKMYFATGFSEGGGLAEYDPRTSAFTAFFQSDGLTTDKLLGIEVEGGTLRLLYEPERMHDDAHSGMYRLNPPGVFDPAAATLTHDGETQYVKSHEFDEAKYARLKELQSRPMPYLGGYVQNSVKIGGKTYLCGTQGLVILDGEEAPPLEMPDLAPTQIKSKMQQFLDEAEESAVRSQNISLDMLEKFLAQDNPYIRADALAAVITPLHDGHAEYVPVICRCVSDPNYRVRSTAVCLLLSVKDNASTAALQIALEDENLNIHSLAALALAGRGQIPPLSYFEEILRNPNAFDNPDFGAKGSLAVLVSPEWVYRALAPHANPEIFELFMRYPPDIRALEFEETVYLPLGAALRNQPEVASMLLEAHDIRGDRTSQEDFARHVFHSAGVEMLPILHEALKSSDLIVRSNAARACGAIGDASSIPHLVKALDIESGPPRDSIVWALGELGADEALP